jgi:hypothetical protein
VELIIIIDFCILGRARLFNPGVNSAIVTITTNLVGDFASINLGTIYLIIILLSYFTPTFFVILYTLNLVVIVTIIGLEF